VSFITIAYSQEEFSSATLERPTLQLNCSNLTLTQPMSGWMQSPQLQGLLLLQVRLLLLLDKATLRLLALLGQLP
jgi:hypothetical protein